MKKAATIFLASLLLYGLSKSFFITTSTQFPPANIVPEAIFVEIVRDLTLLGSWLLYKRDPEKTTDGMRQQSHQKILALYAVDPQAFEESVKYYLEDAPERALKVYEQVYMALDAL